MANDESEKPERKRAARDVVEGFVSDLLDALKDLVSPEPEPVLIPVRRPQRRY